MPLPKQRFALVLIACLMLPTAWLPARSDTDSSATGTVPLRSAALLAPSNSSISFVGIHVGDDPKPRLGGFQDFHGHIGVDPVSGSIETIAVDIDIESVWTQFEKLTSHLKNEDFFETDRFPAARFISTKIEQETAGKSIKGWITGDLTLHGQTREIRFPFEAKLESPGQANGGLQLKSQFKIDRSEFGMDQMLSGVDKMVEIEIAVGRPTRASDAQPGHGGESKKKQASEKPAEKRQVVSLYLPHMT